jgi:GNAT superfamily N-acetyltransferase
VTGAGDPELGESPGMDLVIAGPEEGAARERVMTFLRAEGYGEPIQANDRVFAAWLGSEPVGAVRLAVEHRETVLRGMRIRRDLQRRGIGRQLLSRLSDVLGAGRCYCIPYVWLTTFYSAIGFQVASADQVPTFLAERHASYLKRGLDVVMMVRR